jgi:hypothetical protein
MPVLVGSKTPCIYFQRMRNQENRKIYGRSENFNEVLTPAFKSNIKRTNIDKNEEKNTEKVTSSFTISQLRYNTAKTKFPGSRLVLSGVLRSEDVNWWRIGEANDRLKWVTRALYYCHRVATQLQLNIYHHHMLLVYLNLAIFLSRCTRWRSWLRHCATSRKVEGSIPDGVIVFFLLT